MRRSLIVVALAAVLAAAGAVGVVRDQPDDPAGAAIASGTASSAAYAGLGSGDLGDTVAALQAHLEDVPGDYPGWAALALIYVEQARVSGDASLYDRADKAIARSLDVQPDDNADALAARAAVASARHDFDGALSDADASLAVNPYQRTALVIRVDALVQLGRYADSEAAIREADRRRPGTPVVTRYAYSRELRGDLSGAAGALRTALDGAVRGDRTYLLVVLADVERRLGQLAAAGRHLDEALRIQPGYVLGLVSRARLEVARGETGAAVRTWSDVVRRLPLAEYLTELGELHLLRGEQEEAERQFAVVDASTRVAEASGVDSDLETALFEADHGAPQAALEAARAEWGKRHFLLVADAYAWALHRTGQESEALRLARKATRTGVAEARPWVHRGLIEAALGMDAAARQHLVHGLDLDPGYAPWQARRARAVLDGLGGGR